MYIGHHVKYPLFLSDCNEIEFSRQIFENFSNIKLHENRKVQAEVFHAVRQTNMTKVIVALRCFANAPKNALYEGRAGQTECELVERLNHSTEFTIQH
jgi:hypothetical protein